jgi:hypothetical protein
MQNDRIQKTEKKKTYAPKLPSILEEGKKSLDLKNARKIPAPLLLSKDQFENVIHQIFPCALIEESNYGFKATRPHDKEGRVFIFWDVNKEELVHKNLDVLLSTTGVQASVYLAEKFGMIGIVDKLNKGILKDV